MAVENFLHLLAEGGLIEKPCEAVVGYLIHQGITGFLEGGDVEENGVEKAFSRRMKQGLTAVFDDVQAAAIGIADGILHLIDFSLAELPRDGRKNRGALAGGEKAHEVGADFILKGRRGIVAQHPPEVVGILGEDEAVLGHVIGDEGQLRERRHQRFFLRARGDAIPGHNGAEHTGGDHPIGGFVVRAAEEVDPAQARPALVRQAVHQRETMKDQRGAVRRAQN